jgi:hypothetical protein
MPVNLKTPLAETWKRRLDRWHQSGLSAAIFAKQEKVSEPRLYTWRKRFADASLAPKALALAAPTKAATPDFVPVKLKPTPAPAAGSIELALRSGVTLRLPADVSARRLAEIVKALATC